MMLGKIFRFIGMCDDISKTCTIGATHLFSGVSIIPATKHSKLSFPLVGSPRATRRGENLSLNSAKKVESTLRRRDPTRDAGQAGMTAESVTL